MDTQTLLPVTKRQFLWSSHIIEAQATKNNFKDPLNSKQLSQLSHHRSNCPQLTSPFSPVRPKAYTLARLNLLERSKKRSEAIVEIFIQWKYKFQQRNKNSGRGLPSVRLKNCPEIYLSFSTPPLSILEKGNTGFSASLYNMWVTLDHDRQNKKE